MDAQTLLQEIDIWCQWDATFGEHAQELRQYFVAEPEKLRAILLQMLASRGKQPTRKWLRGWEALKTNVPAPLLRHFLMGLAAKWEWYRGLPSIAETRALVAHEGGRPLVSGASGGYGDIWMSGVRAHERYDTKHWYKKGGTWYECFEEREAQQTHRMAYGALWALVDFPDVQVRDLLMYQIRVEHRQAAIWTMAQWADGDAIARLLLIQHCTAHQGVLVCIENCLLDIASKLDVTVEELKDRAIFTHGLNVQGERTWQVGEHTLRLAISAGGRVQRSVRGADGKTLRRRPPEVEEAWEILGEEAKMLSATLSMRRKRLEAAMKEQRDWSWGEWQITIAANLISRRFAPRLVWNIALPDGSQQAYAVFDERAGWRDAEGEAIRVGGEHRLRVAHPVEMTPEEHAGWQRYLVAHKMVQPFNQIFRETYVLTPAEEETRTYSNRFASHVVPYGTMKALERRGWETSYRACWRDFPRYTIRAYLWAEHDHRRMYENLQQIAFYPIEHNTLWSQPRLDLDPACLPLRDIPAVVFSEVMRDIDQCLVSNSLGTQVQLDEEEVSYRGPAVSSEQAQQRVAMLNELLPLLDLGPTVRSEGRCAYIEGKRCRYRVDLVSGTIYAEPGGRYLCIVPRYDARKLYLPFESDDLKMAEILSKIMLLADDEAITDRTILQQLPVGSVQ